MNPVVKTGITTLSLLAAAAASVVVLTTTHGGGHQITVTMADAGPLVAGSDVRTDGVQVGQVTSIKLVDGRAVMTLSVDSSVVPLHDNATVTVRPINVLGEDYVDLNRGTDARPFTSSMTIPLARTSIAGTLQDVLGTFQAPTAASLGAVVANLGEGLNGNGASTAKALGDLSTSMQVAKQLGDLLSQQNQALSQLIRNADPVGSAIATNNGKTLDSLLASTTDALDAVTAQQGALASTIDQLPATLASAQRTLAQLGGVAAQATPTLQALRPLTGNLAQIVDELGGFAHSANPALSSLPGVLQQANTLLDQAGPVVAALSKSGPQVARIGANVKPISDQLLEKNISGLMGFVRGWALSTNGYDGLSHYFRGVVYVTPTTLKSLLRSLVPAALNLGSKSSGLSGAKGGSGLGGLTSTLHGLTGTLSGLTGTLGNTLNGLLGGRATSKAPTNSAGPLGLTSSQELGMLGQLLGGN